MESVVLDSINPRIVCDTGGRGGVRCEVGLYESLVTSTASISDRCEKGELYSLVLVISLSPRKRYIPVQYNETPHQ